MDRIAGVIKRFGFSPEQVVRMGVEYKLSPEAVLEIADNNGLADERFKGMLKKGFNLDDLGIQKVEDNLSEKKKVAAELLEREERKRLARRAQGEAWIAEEAARRKVAAASGGKELLKMYREIMFQQCKLVQL